MRLKDVSPKWRCGMIGTKTFVISIPADQPVLGLSKERFVNLLDFAEVKLEVEEIYAVFAKPKATLTEGLPRTLRYVGFKLLAPEQHPTVLPSEQFLIMCYKV